MNPARNAVEYQISATLEGFERPHTRTRCPDWDDVQLELTDVLAVPDRTMVACSRSYVGLLKEPALKHHPEAELVDRLH